MLNRTRRTLGYITQAVRSVVAPATPAEQPPVVPDPADVYTADVMPAVDVIEAAAAEYDRAAVLARRADRGKRAAKKVLGRLPAGRYGAWLIERKASARQTPDLAEITRIFKAHSLGPVPMRDVAPSLKVTRAAAQLDTPAAERVLTAA